MSKKSGKNRQGTQAPQANPAANPPAETATETATARVIAAEPQMNAKVTEPLGSPLEDLMVRVRNQGRATYFWPWDVAHLDEQERPNCTKVVLFRGGNPVQGFGCDDRPIAQLAEEISGKYAAMFGLIAAQQLGAGSVETLVKAAAAMVMQRSDLAGKVEALIEERLRPMMESELIRLSVGS